VLATIDAAAAGYEGAALHLHSTACQPSAAASPSPQMTPNPLPPPTFIQPGLAVIDLDMLDVANGWMLVSNCPFTIDATCVNLVVRTIDGGQSWTPPIQVGGAVPVTDGDAPRVIRAVDAQNAFVFGSGGAFATHDSGVTWAGLGFDAVSVAGIASRDDSVWVATGPCAKGKLCPYEVRHSSDAGRTWSAPHQLPLYLTPEDISPFARGAMLASPVSPFDAEITIANGATWRTARTGCQSGVFRATTATIDGVELWQLCQVPDAAGVLATRSLFVSEDGGRSLVQPLLGDVQPAWPVPAATTKAWSVSRRRSARPSCPPTCPSWKSGAARRGAKPIAQRTSAGAGATSNSTCCTTAGPSSASAAAATSTPSS